MVKGRSEINNIKDRYIRELKEMGISVEKVVLFGSYAKGMPREDSDIDFLVVSRDFGNKNIRERLEMLGLAAGRVSEPIEALGCTEEELAEGGFVKEALSKGVELV